MKVVKKTVDTFDAVQVKNVSSHPDLITFAGELYLSVKDRQPRNGMIVDWIPIVEGNWLVTDKHGNVTVYGMVEFEETYVLPDEFARDIKS